MALPRAFARARKSSSLKTPAAHRGGQLAKAVPGDKIGGKTGLLEESDTAPR